MNRQNKCVELEMSTITLLITLTVFCLEDPTNVAMFYSLIY